MFNKQFFSTIVRSPLLARIGYPFGVVVIFSCIFLSAFFSYRFFSSMIERIMKPSSLTIKHGATFHLDEYRAVAPFFHLLPVVKEEISSASHEKVVVAFINAQLRNDRVIAVQDILKSNGWTAVAREDKTKTDALSVEPLTTITAKETNINDAEVITALLVKNGFIVVRGKPLSNAEKADILITLGAY